MKHEAQRIAIAEECGWTKCYQCAPSMSLCNGIPPGESHYDHLPDYINDLNAMHEAEKMLNVPQMREYRSRLAVMFTDHPDDGLAQAINATATQRAEAFLRTLNLWKDEN